VELSGREAVHPTSWLLVRSHLGVLTEAEAGFVRRHLDEHRCARCRQRAAELSPLPSFVFSEPVSLPLPRAAAATSPPLGALSTDEAYPVEVELFQEGDDLVLEIRTTDPVLGQAVMAYSLMGRGGELVEGLARMLPDVAPWFSAHLPFSAETLFSRLDGRLERTIITPVDPVLLTDEERNAVSAPRAQG